MCLPVLVCVDRIEYCIAIGLLLDPQGQGSIGLADFTKGFMRIRGEAKAKELLAITRQSQRKSGHIIYIYMMIFIYIYLCTYVYIYNWSDTDRCTDEYKGAMA